MRQQVCCRARWPLRAPRGVPLDGERPSCHGKQVRWEQLFADLNSQFAELADGETLAELPDRQRTETGRLTIVQRCRGNIGASVRVRLRGGKVHSGELRDVGPDWILLDAGSSGELLIALSAVTTMEGLSARTGAQLSPVDGRFDLRLALRRIARDRAPVMVGVIDGSADRQAGGTDLAGTIDRIGADFIELAQHPVWEPRRGSSVNSMLLIPLAAIDSVRAMSQG